MKRKIFSILTLMCMVITIISSCITVFAERGTCGANLIWMFEFNGTLTIAGTGDMYNYSYLDDVPWYSYRSSIKSVAIGNGVTSICGDAFWNCSDLKNVYISDLTAWCNINFFNYYSNPLNNGANLYIDDNLATDITIPDSVTSIGEYAFFGCSSLTSVTIPDSVTSIGVSAFSDCSSITNVYYNGNEDRWNNIYIDSCNECLTYAPRNYFWYVTIVDDSGVEVSKEKYDLGTILRETDFSVFQKSGYDMEIYADSQYKERVSVTIPVEENLTLYLKYRERQSSGSSGGGGSDVENSGTCGDNFTWVLDENGTLTISGTGAMTEAPWHLSSSLIKSVVITNGVTSIGDYAFSDCSNLTSITIPDSVTKIGVYAFYDCISLTSIAIPDNVTSISSSAFSDCSNLTSITIPDSVTNIGEYAFYKTGYYNNNLNWENEVLYIGNYLIKAKSTITFCEIKPRTKVIVNGAFDGCKNLSSVKIPDNVTTIGNSAFENCSSLIDVIISERVTSIGEYAFYNCSSLTNVYYNGNEDSWNNISIGSNNRYLKNATRNYFWYVTIIGEDGKEISKLKCNLNSPADISAIEKAGYSIQAFTDSECKNEFDLKTPITENTTLYLKYVTKQYTYKFLDNDNTVLKEATVDYGTKIVPPENPTKENTEQYTYTFDNWSGYTEGMTVTENATFTAQYTETVNKYTYKFVDEDGTVLKEETVDYNTVINLPETPADKGPYTFDYWKGYTNGMKATADVEFKAIYKYKTYTIMVDGLENPVNVVYGDTFELETQTPESEYLFDGYYTEKNGKGTKITDEKGKSLNQYTTVGNLKVYPYFKATHFNKTEVCGSDSPMPGDTITQNVVFATDKTARYFVFTVKYPEYLNFEGLETVDFKYATKKETTENKVKVLTVTCDYGSNIPINKNMAPVKIKFKVGTNAPIEKTVVNLSSAVLKLNGSNQYQVTDLKGNTIEIKPKLAESIGIFVADSIDKITKCEAVVLPNYTTDRSVTWAVDNEEFATISSDGTLTPLKNGTVTVTATANDGSGKSGQKTVNIVAYAKPNSIKYNGNSVEILPDVYEYTVYVKENDKTVTLNVDFADGSVMINDEICIPDDDMFFELKDNENIFNIQYSDYVGYTNKTYTIKVIKFEGTQTTVSEGGKTFTVKPINIANGNTIILALYNGDTFVGMEEPKVYNGEDVIFTTTKDYTNAKIMVWDSLGGMIPICEAEDIE